MNLSDENDIAFSSNSTYQEVTFSNVLFYVFILIPNVCGNLLVIISIAHFKQLHTPTNLLILSLATTDLMVGIADVPFQLIFNNVMPMDGTLYFLSVLGVCHFTFLSIYNICLISLDRFYALSNPLLYSNKITVKVSCIVICSLWLFSGLHSLIFSYFYWAANMFPDNSVLKANAILANIFFFVVFVLPCSGIIILYMKIFVIARRHAKSIRCTRGQHISGNLKYGEHVPKVSERKAVTKLGILVIVFIMCLLPCFIVNQLGALIPATAFGQALTMTGMIQEINSAINPIIYALIYPWFRRCAKLILTHKIFSHNSSLITVLITVIMKYLVSLDS